MRAPKTIGRVPLLLVLVLAACTHSRLLEISAPFPGIRESLTASKSLVVLVVHGISCHAPGYSEDLQRGVSSHLGLVEIPSLRSMLELDTEQLRIQSWRRGAHVRGAGTNVPCGGEPEPPTLFSRTYQGSEGEQLTFVEVTWSPLSEGLKRKELAHEYDAAERTRRAAFNDRLKTSIVNERLADAVVYLGQTRDEIQWVVQQGLCLMAYDVAWDAERHKPLCSHDDNKRKGRFIIVTESLGSRIVFDTLWSPSLGLVDRELLPQVDAVYMLANQLPLIELASNGKEAADTVRSVSRDLFVTHFDAWLKVVEATFGDAEQVCSGGLEEVKKDSKAWQLEINKLLDPAEHSKAVIHAQTDVDENRLRIDRLTEQRTKLDVKLGENRSAQDVIERDIEAAKVRQRVLEGQLDQSQQEKSLANQQLSEARREVTKLDVESDILEAEKIRTEEVRRRATSATGEALETARLFTEQLRKSTAELAKLATFRLQGSSLAGFQRRKDNASLLLKRLQEARSNIDKKPSNVQVSVTALKALDRGIEAIRNNLATLAQAKATQLCDGGCKSLEQTNLKGTGELHHLYSELRSKNDAMQTSNQALRTGQRRIAESQKKVAQLAEAPTMLITTQTAAHQSSATLHQLQGERRSTVVELEGLLAQQRTLRAQAEKYGRERAATESELTGATLALPEYQRALELARSQSQAEALVGQYAFRLLLYKDSSKELEDLLELIDARVAGREKSEEIRDQNAVRCLKYLREQVTKQPAPNKLPTFVAMNDPNDLLGYQIPEDLAKSYRTPFANVSLRLTNEYLRLFADPAGAHSRHAKSKRALQLIACGAKKGEGSRFVPATCTESVGVEQLSPDHVGPLKDDN